MVKHLDEEEEEEDDDSDSSGEENPSCSKIIAERDSMVLVGDNKLKVRGGIIKAVSLDDK